MSLSAIFFGGGTALIVLLSLIQISPISINPWSAIGQAINKNLVDSISRLEEDVIALREDIKEQAAINCRARILRFGDEVVHGDLHSKEHFDQTLRDIASYNAYCDDHKDFENKVTALTSQKIEEIYMERLDKNDFL